MGAVLVDVTGDIIDEFQLPICPEVLDERCGVALKISGLTREFLQDHGESPDYARDAALEWVAIRRASAPDLYSTAFNVGFDKPMMGRMGLHMDPWGPCIMKVAQTEMGRAGALPQFSNGAYKFPKLSEASEFYRVPMTEPAHRALADAKTAAAIMVAIQRRRA